MKSNSTTLFDDLMEGLLAMEQQLTQEKALKDEVKNIRATLNLSQQSLADKLKMSVRTLQNWEQGRTVPNAHSLMLLRMAGKEPKLFDVVAGM